MELLTLSTVLILLVIIARVIGDFSCASINSKKLHKINE